MINLSKDSKIIKWAYLQFWPYTHIEDGPTIDRQTNLCSLFWRSVLLVPLVLAATPVIAVIMGIIAVVMIIGSFIKDRFEAFGEWLNRSSHRLLRHRGLRSRMSRDSLI